MSEKKKYNSILISGRKDETLTCSKYVKDEESGESVKESLDKKVNVTDELTTQQIKDGAITNEKMAAGSVGNTNLQDGSVSNEKLEDGSVTNEKLAENSITKDKLKDNTIGVEKLDPELRQTINAATGLPENLVETIQNVDDTLKDHQRQIDDKQSQIDDKQQQITANDDDISLLQTRSTQMEETIKNIAATGGASQATAVTYDNEKSKLTAVNIQSAVDEVVDKTAIKDEEGTVIETPFRYIQNEEFIKAIVDTEDHFLLGIRFDGSIEWGNGIPAPIRAKLQEIISRCQQDKTDILEAINTAKEDLSASIAALQEGKVDKEEGKSLIEDEVKERFKVIENEEFIYAVIDSENRLLFGIYRATGKPYFPLNEMYHVEQNEEFFAVWLDSANHVLFGIRRDGQIIGEIHAVNALKQVVSQLQSDIASLQEKVGAIDANLKELLDVFSLQENPEYMAVEKDADGKVLSATNADGSHYIHNAKSETIPTEFSHIEDPEGRTEITVDVEGKLLGYRDKNGIRHETVGMNLPAYYMNGEKQDWVNKSDVVNVINKTDKEISINIFDGVSDHNTPNLLISAEIQKTFSDGVNNFTPPNAGYEMSNRIDCQAGDWFTRTGTATGMIVVTDENDKNGKRLFAPDGTTLGSTFQVPLTLTWVRYIRMAVEAESAKEGNVVICKGKDAFSGSQKGKYVTIDSLRILPSNLSNDAKFLKASNGDYYELYLDESDFSIKVRKVDPSVITNLPSDFPSYKTTGNFADYFKSVVSMADLYVAEQNQNGILALQKTGVNVFYYAEFRKEKSPSGEIRYIVMYPYGSYKGLKGETGMTIYDSDFNVIETGISCNKQTFDAHDFIYIDDDHIIACGASGGKNVSLQSGSETITKYSEDWSIFELKKVNGIWNELASFHMNDYPKLLTDGVNKGNNSIRNHWNTIQLDYDGNLLMNMRDMNCFWKIKRTVNSDGTIIIGSKTNNYDEAIIGRVGGVYNSGYIDSKRVIDEGFSFTDIPTDLEVRSTDEPPLWKFYHEHHTTYWGMKNIGSVEYPTYLIFDNNMWTGENGSANYDDLNPRNNYKNNPTANNESHFAASKSDDGGNYDTHMVSRVVQISIDWENHLIKDSRVYIVPKEYSSTRGSCQMLDEGILLISFPDASDVGLYDFNDRQTVVKGNLYSNGKEVFHMKKSSYRVHGYNY